MYRVGVIINENEASHSKYADTVATLKSAIDECNRNGSTANSYHFIVYDKFTIDSLFDSRENDIASLDALVFATNALSFGEKIHNTVVAQKKRLEEFLEHRKGILICSQKKLSNGGLSSERYRSAGILPDPYDYYLFDRPESSSAEGKLSASPSSVLLDYPYKIDNELIENRCTNNQFMAHKYRSLIIQKHPHAYQVLVCDEESKKITQKNLGFFDESRNVLVYSGGSKRIVLSTIALDWANHAELLSNILTFITESEPRVFFVKKGGEETKSAIIDSYKIRANIANIPYRAIAHTEIQNCAKSAGNAFIFSPIWTPDEIEQVYAKMLLSERDHFTIYHISNTNALADKNHKLIKYRNYSSIDLMKDAVVQSLLLSFQSTFWGKSVWTYSYVSKLMLFYDIKAPIIASRLYQELALHFSKIEPTTGKRAVSGDYDGVFNATCKMLEVLNIFALMYNGTITCEEMDCEIKDIISSAEEWVNWRAIEGAVFDQDICYYMLYLAGFSKLDTLDKNIRATLVSLFEQLLARIAQEVLSGRIASRSSVDLCRIYQTLCVLTMEKMVAPDNLVAYLTHIETTLRDRQDPHGNWKHISETAELTLMLLEAYGARSKINHELHTINTLITKGVEALHSQYNARTSMWADDIGATAKAMNAIGLYDKLFNFSINDFFSDLKLHREPNVLLGDELTKERIGAFYRAIDGVEKEKNLIVQQLKESESAVSKMQRRLFRTKNALVSSLTLLVGTASLLILLVVLLYVDHRDVLINTLDDWRVVIKDGIVAMIVAVAASETIRWLNKKFKD